MTWISKADNLWYRVYLPKGTVLKVHDFVDSLKYQNPFNKKNKMMTYVTSWSLSMGQWYKIYGQINTEMVYQI